MADLRRIVGDRQGRKHPVLFLLTVLAAPSLWLLFVGSFALQELLVGLAASFVTILFTLFVCRSSGLELDLRLPDLLRAWRIPWYIVSDVWQVVRVLFEDLLGIRPVRSVYGVCGFDTSTHDPVRRARTTLAVAYTTTTPNLIVLGIDPSQSRMLYHQLAAGTLPRMTRELGAKA